jgi:rubrerythrin
MQDTREDGVTQSNEWWAGISHAFASHVRDESYVLDRYAELAASTADPGTRFLLQLILADEQRHHQVFEQLRAAAAPDASAENLPGPPDPPAAEVPVLLEQTQRFIDFEHEDAASLKTLDRQLRASETGTLWRLLVELMELDTEKHLRILDYLKRHLEDRARHDGRPDRRG